MLLAADASRIGAHINPVVVRTTVDIDVLVPRDLPNMTRLLRALEGLPYGLARELDAKEIVPGASSLLHRPAADATVQACAP